MADDGSRLRYRLYEKLAGGEVATYLGKAPDGDRVMVHFLTGSPGRDRSLLARLEARRAPGGRGGGAAGTGGRSREFAAGDRPVVVTEVLEGFRSLETWLADRETAAGGATASGRAPSASPAGSGRKEEAGGDDSPGEFTRLFILGERTLDETPPSAAEGGREERPTGPGRGHRPGPADGGAEMPPAEPSGAGEDGAAEPGEFTRQFLLGASDRDASEPPPGSDRTVPGKPEAEGRGDGGGEEGEGRGASPRPEAERHPSTASGRSSDSPDRESRPGEFTRLFGRGEREPAEPDLGRLEWRRPSPEAPSPDDGYLERLAGSSSGPSGPSGAAPSSEAAPPSGARRERDEASPPSGPGRYTEIVGGSGGSGPEAPAGGAPAGGTPAGGTPAGGETATSGAGEGAGESTEDEGPGRRRYLLALGGILLVAALLVIALALLAGSGEETGGPGVEPPAPEAPAAESGIPRPGEAESGVTPPGEGG